MESEFMRMQREATEQLRKMNARAVPPRAESKHSEAAKPLTERPREKKGDPLFSDDKTLLLFLLFLLYSDGSDPLLMLALLYLLM